MCKLRKKTIFMAAAVISAVFAAVSCHKDEPVDTGSRKVLLMYAAAHNNLRDDIYADLQDLKKGYLPAKSEGNDVLLVFQRLSRTSSSSGMTSENQTAPVLLRYYKGSAGMAAVDTLKVFPKNTNAADPSTVREVLDFVRTAFPAGNYGMIFSSHASGWVPKGYYSNSASFERSAAVSGYSAIDATFPSGAVPYVEPELKKGEPRVKSIGMDVVDGNSYELTLRELKDAIPFKLDYIIFDACLMGCIETAYELRSVADIMAFSPAEVLAEGLDYTTLASRLLEGAEPDVEGVCSDYYDYYNSQSGEMRAATVTMVDLRRIQPVADVCAKLFEKYRSAIAALKPEDVQRYYRYSYRWYYDLQDILLQAGINESEQAELQAALDDFIIYKAATPYFMTSLYGGFEIRHYSGLSMYLPIATSTYLNAFYRSDIEWNAATGLLK